MKKTILFLAITCFTFAARAQNVFPLAELEKLTNKNASDFETVMLGKDYSIQTKLSSAVNKVYWSDKANADGKKNTASRAQVPNSVANIGFSTTDKKWYLELKSQLAATGFKFSSQENKTINGLKADWFNFSNGVYHISICSYTTDVTWFAAQIYL